MSLSTRLARVEQWRRPDAETFVTRLQDRLARAIPSLDPVAVAAMIAAWCTADRTLEGRWLAGCVTLGLVNPDGTRGPRWPAEADV